MGVRIQGKKSRTEVELIVQTKVTPPAAAHLELAEIFNLGSDNSNNCAEYLTVSVFTINKKYFGYDNL